MERRSFLAFLASAPFLHVAAEPALAVADPRKVAHMLSMNSLYGKMAAPVRMVQMNVIPVSTLSVVEPGGYGLISITTQRAFRLNRILSRSAVPFTFLEAVIGQSHQLPTDTLDSELFSEVAPYGQQLNWGTLAPGMKFEALIRNRSNEPQSHFGALIGETFFDETPGETS